MKLRLRNSSGATVVEYVIMLLLIALAVMGLMRVFGKTISEKVEDATYGVENMEKKRGLARNDPRSLKRKQNGSQKANQAEGREKKKKEPGINLIVLLIAIALIGLLIYVMGAKKKGS